MPEPPLRENKALTWPHWPMKLRTSSSQEEGAAREFSVVSTELRGEDGFKVAAYRRAADTLAHEPSDVVGAYRAGTPPRLPGVGKAIDEKLALR